MNSEKFKTLIKSIEVVEVELGCGPYKKKGVIGIDSLTAEGVDIVANIEEGLAFIPDNSVDVLTSKHFLEHIQNLEFLISEIHRVLKPGGKHIAIVPHFSNAYYYSDITHKKFFGLYTFDYYATEESKLKRKVPSFYQTKKFRIVKRKLVFKSPFLIRNYFKRVIQMLVNMGDYTREYYEECMTGIISCSEIYFEMRVEK